VERYPEIMYRSTRVRPGDGDEWYVAGCSHHGGFSFFGDREAKATPGEGPALRVTPVAIVGVVEIRERAVLRTSPTGAG
jgi:hypothetical protein